MICFVNPVVTEGCYIVQKEEFLILYYIYDTYTWRKATSITDETIFSSERMLRKDYYRKVSIQKKIISGHESQGAWSQDELFGGKLPVVK
jgi:hypothetical protein